MGEEIAMTNVEYGIEDYRDLEILNWYNEKIDQGFSPKDLMPSIHKMGRDNARTPMQWDDSENGGFTKGTPWLKVNPNYVDINVKAAKADNDGVWPWYQALIALRKREKTLVYGKYEPIMEHSDAVFAYRRTDANGDFLVLVNLSDHDVKVDLPAGVLDVIWKPLLNNVSSNEWRDRLMPWQAIILERT
jgi:oligo-1,6-glucosidase